MLPMPPQPCPPVGFPRIGGKLNSSPDRTGNGLLPSHDDGRAADQYSTLGLTGDEVRLLESYSLALG